jgi:hypothetical protein
MANPPSGKETDVERPPPSQQEILTSQLAELIHTIRSLHEYDRAIRRQGEMRAFAKSAESEEPIFIDFEKKSGPEIVRINMRDNGFPAMLAGDDAGKSDARQAGDRLEASVEVEGNPGEMAVITIKNAIPDTIKLGIPPGETGEIATFPLLVLG